jgi:hypothetical protein
MLVVIGFVTLNVVALGIAAIHDRRVSREERSHAIMDR